MTAEIAIMNKGAVALAADSAVTFSPAPLPGTALKDAKIYHSVNKLFTLSKYRPVGVMVYGSADFMGVPWETIIKTYRARLGTRDHESLQAHADAFVEFLGTCGLFSEKQASRFFELAVREFFDGIREDIDNRVRERLAKRGPITAMGLERVVAAAVNGSLRDLRKHYETLPALKKLPRKRWLQEHRQQIEKIRSSVFERLPMSDRTEQALRALVADLLFRNRFTHRSSGVVIAGFGQRDTYPSLASYAIEGILGGCLRYDRGPLQQVTDDMTAAIIPFAQQEMVHTFMEGVDPYYQQTVEGLVKGLFESYPGALVKGIPGMKQQQKKRLVEKLKSITPDLLRGFQDGISSYRRRHHVDPIVQAVSLLPKDELAAMAESLVNLTSFKRRISIGEAETVGGPIDVAVISKGDGFIWIKRKHYFAGELNPHFLANYYRDDEPPPRRNGERLGEG